MAYIVSAVNSANPVRAFEALAKVIGEKEEVNITLKSLKKKGEERKEESEKS